MQPLRRNQQPFYYANRVDSPPLSDDGGVNGQFGVIYSAPVEGSGNFAPATGEKYTQQFGETLDYDEVLLPDLKCDIDEYSVLWRDCEKPLMNPDGTFTPPWTHEVKRVAGSLNGTLVAIKRVHVR